MRLVQLHSAAVLAFWTAVPAVAQTPAACAGLAPDSAEAAILGCFRPTTPPTPLPPDLGPAPKPLAGEAPEPASEPFTGTAPEPVPDTLAAPTSEPLGDAAIVDREPPPSPPVRNEALVQVFADWLERHPIGRTLDPSEARLLEVADLPVGLPTLPLGRSYAEVDGMIVELDTETGDLLRLVRRAPVLAEVPQPPVVVPDMEPDVSQADDAEERRLEEAARAQAELEAAERLQEERDDEAAERALEELARQAEERELEERALRAEEVAREAAERAEAERERAEELAREIAEQEREQREEHDRREDEGRRGEAQALDIPNGHLPPPGSCRVWFPDRPPGHQPPPTSCDVEVPAGAVLIRGYEAHLGSSADRSSAELLAPISSATVATGDLALNTHNEC